MTKRTRKKWKQGHGSKQNQFRVDARRAMPNLPPDVRLRIEPRGEVGMSEVLAAFV